MGFDQGVDDLGREIIAFQSHGVDASWSCRIAFEQHVWGYVVPDGAGARHEAVAADRGEVMHRNGARERGMIVNVNVSCQQGIVGNDDVVAQLTIVGNVGACHQEVVITDMSDALFLFRCPVDGRALADNIVVADDHFGIATGIADVLRLTADHRVGVNVIVATDGDITHQGHVVFQLCSASDAHLRPDNAIGPDLDVIVDFGTRVNGCVFGKIIGHGRDSFTVIGLGATLKRFLRPSLGNDCADQLRVEPMSTAIGDHSPDKVATHQGKVAHHVNHLVTHAFVREAVRF